MSCRPMTLLLCLAGLAGAQMAPAAEPSGPAVLDTASLWRCRVSLGTELARLGDGSLAPVHPDTYLERVREGNESTVRLRKHERSWVWPTPPAGWTAPEFDDRSWCVQRGPFCTGGYYKGETARYRSVPLLLLRGAFHVADPAAAGGLQLSVDFEGGLVAYLNGRELVRAHLPAGRLEPGTPAEDYAATAFVDEKGLLLDRKFPDEKLAERYRLRTRQVRAVRVPAALLRKGVNVLALELHRAPAPEVFFTGKSRRIEEIYTNPQHVKEFAWWSRIALASVKLIAADGAAVTPNAGQVGRPPGLCVWNQPVHQRVYTTDWANAFEPPAPVRLVGARNGSYSGQVVVGCDQALRGLVATCSALAGAAGAEIPASAIQIRYGLPDGGDSPEAAWFEGLEEHPPQEVPAAEQAGGAVQPIWLTARVPDDAAAGEYRGTLAVAAEGRDAVSVPVHLRVVAWRVPDAKDFFAHVGLWQSPDSVALQYEVPMWSERHWQLLDRTFALMGQVGAKIVHVTAIRQTHGGNQHAMIRFARQADGTLKPDFRIARRYVDLAVRHLGKVPVVCLYCWDTFDSSGKKHFGHYERKDREILISVLDPAGGEPTEAVGPEWGTPQCRAFWKPVVDGMRQILAEHGMAGSLMLGVAGDFEPSETALDDLREASGGLPWVFNSHVVRHAIGPERKDAAGYIASAWGGHTSHVDPDFGRGYGWKNPFIRTMTRWFPRYPVTQRWCLEALVTSRMSPRRAGDQPEYGLRGIGRIGADFWPVLRDKRGRSSPLAGRYPDTEWGQLGLRHSLLALLSPGRDGAIGTVRFEMLRENQQEIEARIYLEKALADPARRERLGEPLAARVQELLDGRVRTANCAYADRDRHAALGLQTAELSEALYEAAAEAAARLGP